MGSRLLVGEGLERRFGATHAVRGASLAVQAGDYTALLGPSGCGKTTLLMMLGLLERPDAGKVLLAGEDPWRLTAAARAGLRLSTIGFVLQRHHLLPTLNVRENVALPAWRLTGRRADALERADALLERVGLTGRRDIAASVLSVGEAQRAAVARAVINDPLLILADEPTGALDSHGAAAIIELLGGFAERDRALLMVTHDLALAGAARRCVHMRDGVLNE